MHIIGHMRLTIKQSSISISWTQWNIPVVSKWYTSPSAPGGTARCLEGLALYEERDNTHILCTIKMGYSILTPSSPSQESENVEILVELDK